MAVEFVGSYVALVTPFNDDGSVNYAKIEELVEFHIANGTDGLVPVGTTGESPTLTHEEHEKVIEVVVKKVNKRIKVVAGTGSNSTAKTVEMTRFAKNVGADGALVVVPYYNKPTQEGLFLHFKAVAEVGLPVVLYNIPGRSGVNMTPATIIRLSKVPNVVAIKEATGSMDQTSEILKGAPNLTVLSGDDSLTLPLISLGAKGVISVIGNIAPKHLKQLVSAAMAGDNNTARKLHYELFTLCRVMFVETNPIPIKAAMGMLGLCSDNLRLPMSPISDANRATIKSALEEAGLLKK
jgi:4-hydroxy-tetrahydrodipicolinate synthase